MNNRRQIMRLATKVMATALVVSLVPVAGALALVGLDEAPWVSIHQARIQAPDSADLDTGYVEWINAADASLDEAAYQDGHGSQAVEQAMLDLADQTALEGGFIRPDGDSFSLGGAALAPTFDLVYNDQAPPPADDGSSASGGDSLTADGGDVPVVSVWVEPSQAGTGQASAGRDAMGVAQAPDVIINEIRIDEPPYVPQPPPPSTPEPADLNEYFELHGPPGASLDGLTYLVIGDCDTDGPPGCGSPGNQGIVEAVIDLSGTIPSSGYFVVAEETLSPTLGTADLTAVLSFENSDNVTHLLVWGFTGTLGIDLDTLDEFGNPAEAGDGKLDLEPWSERVDCVVLDEGTNDFVYCDIASVGPDDTFSPKRVPAHAFFCSVGWELEGWQIGQFEPIGGDDTPGAANPCGAPPNAPPVAVDDAYSTAEDTSLTVAVQGGVLSNDTDADGDNLTAALDSGPSGGALTLNADGSFIYTPTLNFTGVASFTYRANDGQADSNVATVSITVTPVNDPPVANDDSVTTPEETAATIDVAANDTDVDGDLDPTTANIACATCSEPAHGTLTNLGDGSFTYMPDADFSGTDSFVYEICDSVSLCDTATVTITVNPLNDAPVANDDSATTLEDTGLTIDVAANDTDVDGDLDPTTADTACATCSVPAHGTLTNLGDGSFTYMPDADFNGVDSFVYEICDSGSLCDTATVTITVNPLNDAPVANDDSATTLEDTGLTIDVAANDTDVDGDLDPTTADTACATCSVPAHGTLTNLGDGSFTYMPNAGFSGTDSFVYEICDSVSLCDTATVSITVNPVNDPPVANDDSATTPQETAVTIDVAANDTDVNGDLDPTTANTACATCSEPAHGTLTNLGDGSFTYMPNAGFSGTDSFVYEICDSVSLCDTATVTITVEPVNNPPDCSGAEPSIDTIWPPDHKFVSIKVKGVTDPDGDEVEITIDSIFQDEPVDTWGDGSFTPDGRGVGSSMAQVRAERAGSKKVPGNGRVYHIGFEAEDGQGGTCWGEVQVGVPGDQRQGEAPVDVWVDDGPLYDSTALAP